MCDLMTRTNMHELDTHMNFMIYGKNNSNIIIIIIIIASKASFLVKSMAIMSIYIIIFNN